MLSYLHIKHVNNSKRRGCSQLYVKGLAMSYYWTLEYIITLLFLIFLMCKLEIM